MMSAGEVQRGWKEGGEHLPVLPPAWDHGDATRQRGRGAAQRGTGLGPSFFSAHRCLKMWARRLNRAAFYRQRFTVPLSMGVFLQTKYKESGRKEMSSSLCSSLSDTSETSFAREVTDMLSEVKDPPPLICCRPEQNLKLTNSVHVTLDEKTQWSAFYFTISLGTYPGNFPVIFCKVSCKELRIKINLNSSKYLVVWVLTNSLCILLVH